MSLLFIRLQIANAHNAHAPNKCDLIDIVHYSIIAIYTLNIQPMQSARLKI